MPGGRPPSDEKQRFLAKVKIVESGCHEWTSGLSRVGYGKFYFRGVVGAQAHRAAYELFVGSIPKGQHVLHKCDNRKCVNPEHLFTGSTADNVADMDAKNRRGTKSTLTYADVEVIQDMLDAKFTQAEVAKRFGVDQTTISRIRLGKTTLFKEN